MSPHVDILEDRERLGRPLLGSIAFHALLIGVVAGVGVIRQGDTLKLGAEKPGGGIGSVAITPVNSIPLPATAAPKNPVANETPSQVPVPKEAPKPVEKPKPQVRKVDPNALPIPGGFTKKQYAKVDKYREKQQDRPNQMYSNSGQQLSSEMFAMQGSGRMGLGDNSPLGNQFGAYARILRDMVASKWRTTDIAANIRTAPQVIVTFTLHRDGTATNVHVTQSSGNSALDRSGQRAILDAAPFPKMPPQFPKDQTDIDFVFELKR
ncbi:MAG TPA: TonB family protein [Candidatus Acidoferrum sp.]|jgi:protein TonB|nr:TonB family protein [Candidatus Acidoferrum sp.]